SATLDGLLLRDLDGNNALPWDVLARTLAAEASPGDAAAVNITAYNWALEVQTADYHLHSLPLAFTLVEELPAEGFDAAARAFVGDAPRVWLGVDKRLPSRGGDAAFAAALAGQYVPCGIVFDLPRLRLDRYERLPADAFDPGAPGLGRFGAGITLVHADLTPQSALLAWRLDDAVPRGTYSVALHVVDAAGGLRAQVDYGLPDDALACRVTSLPTRDLPPGGYTLYALVYDWATGTRLTVDGAERLALLSWEEAE
ncbi:MAG: hypothetical protein JNJ61_04275, partial [Anaerolineae bacterium]|nr:hypothetical protein [Anaerolineae bacterium]